MDAPLLRRLKLITAGPSQNLNGCLFYWCASARGPRNGASSAHDDTMRGPHPTREISMICYTLVWFGSMSVSFSSTASAEGRQTGHWATGSLSR